jgi:hypothetical protein
MKTLPSVVEDVCYRRKSGKYLLVPSISQFVEGVIAASWEGRYRSPPRPKSLREIMKEKESNERD